MPLPEKGVVQSFAQQTRDEIAQRRAEEVKAEIKEGGGDPNLLEGENEDKGDPLRPESVPVEDWAAMSDEAKGEAIKSAEAEKKAAEKPEETEEEKAAREAEEKKAADEAAAAAAAEAPAPKKFKGKVDGQDVEFDEAAVVEAGLRALQKESAADKRLEEATRAREEAERLRQSVEATLAKVPQGDQPAKNPEEMVAAKDRLRETIKKIQYGGEEEAAAAMEQYVSEMVTAGQPKALTEHELQNILDLREAQKFVKTNYADVMGDDNLKHLFVTKVNAKLAAGDHRPYQDICKDIGDEIRTWRGATQKEPIQPPADGSRAAVRERKNTIVRIPSASARQPAPTQPKEPSPSETIDKMRKARHQTV